MKIELKANYGFTLQIEAGDGDISFSEDIESRIYSKDENGKTDYTKPPKRDIRTDIIEQFVRVLDDMIDYRVEEFDSSVLIKTLFEKLPQDIAIELLNELCRDFNEE